jgi:hypothetical protein
MKTILSILALIIFSAGTGSAQSEVDLKRYFEGRRVEVKMDMPATRGGVIVHPERGQAVDYGKYADRLKEFGISVREGDRVMITKVKVVKRHVEILLGGGGYGSWNDETVPYVYVPTVGKSRREERLEKELKNEADRERRRELREELDDLRRERRREEQRNRAEVAEAEELARQRIQEKRLQAGSRFIIQYDRELTSRDLTPEAVMNALRKYVYFDQAER